MIDFFRLWSKNIVGAVVIATLIEMILPNNNSKKYIKIVTGIFVAFTIISPIIDSFSSGKNFDEITDFEQYIEASSSSIVEKQDLATSTNNSIIKIYSQNLQNDIRAKLKNKGYIAEDVNVKIAGDGSYNIEQIEVRIVEKIKLDDAKKEAKTIVDSIKYVVVQVDSSKSQDDKSVINEYERGFIKNFLTEEYGAKDIVVR